MKILPNVNGRYKTTQSTITHFSYIQMVKMALVCQTYKTKLTKKKVNNAQMMFQIIKTGKKNILKNAYFEKNQLTGFSFL